MKFSLSVVVLVVFSLCGCSTIYKSPQSLTIPSESISILEHPKSADNRIHILNIDGDIKAGNRRNELAPGEHRILVCFEETRSFMVGTTMFTNTSRSESLGFNFQTDPGKTYILNAIVEHPSRVWKVWITDKQTDQTIASLGPVFSK